MDIKEWIQEKADDLAFDKFWCYFNELPEEEQKAIYSQAVDLFGETLSDMIVNAIIIQQDICYGCLDYTVRCGKYPCKKVEVNNPPHYKCIRCCEYLNPDNNCPCNDVLKS